jgi:membrane protein
MMESGVVGLAIKIKMPNFLDDKAVGDRSAWYHRFFRFLARILESMTVLRVGSLAAEIAYYLLLAFFPFLIFLVSAAGQIAQPYQQHLYTQLQAVLPLPVYAVVSAILQEIVKNSSWPLMSFSMLGVIWAASNGFAVILRGLNQSYGNWQPSTYTFLIMRGLGLLFTILLSFAVFLTLTLITFGNMLLEKLAEITNLPILSGNWILAIRYVFTFIVLMIIFSVLYHLVSRGRGNRRRQVSYWQALPGATFTALAWLGLSWAFSFYVSHFGRYASIYGSLGGLVLLMLWINLCSTVVLTGGILNATLFDLALPPIVSETVKDHEGKPLAF